MKWIWLLIMLTGCSGSVTLENDYGNPFQKNVDKYYTHGTKFSYFEETETEKKTYSIGQNIYTPSVKKESADLEILLKDRPYAGWLYGEYRSTNYSNENTKSTLGIQIGCTGRCSQAKEVQQGVHKLLDQGQPTWDKRFSLRSEPGIILAAERSYLLSRREHADFATYGSLKVGTIINSAAIGADARIGYGLDKFASEPITFKVPRPSWVAYVFARIEERFVAWNSLLDGSMFQNERHTVTSEPLVTEGDIGFTVGFGKLKLTYRLTAFSSEWKESQGKGGVAFGGLDLTW